MMRPAFLIPAIFILLLLYTARINWSTGQWEHVIKADGKGYYAYLPAVFIYHDLNFGFFHAAEVDHPYDKTLYYDYRSTCHGSVIDKYFIGEAILISPFFLMAHVLSLALGFPADGYSQLYIIFLTIAAVFYACFGLHFLKKTLSLYGIGDRSIIFIILAIILGTNLFYYTIGEMSMSHVYSFALVSFFIFHVKKYFREYRSENIIYASAALGFIVLTRPVNGLVVLSIPFLSGDYTAFLSGIKKYLRSPYTLIFSVTLLVTIPFIQLFVYKLQTGTFLVYSYGNESFNFLEPHIYNFLFSYKKGLFVYTPLCFIGLFGFIPMAKNKFEFFSLMIFLILTVYMLSAWWMWYYGGSFSSRVMVEYLPYFGILLAVLTTWLRKRIAKSILVGLIAFTILLNQVQTLQYRYFFIHWSEMNKEKYWHTFMDIRSLFIMKSNNIKPSSKPK